MKHIQNTRVEKDHQDRMPLTNEEQPSGTLELTDEELAGITGAFGPCDLSLGGGYGFGGNLSLGVGGGYGFGSNCDFGSGYGFDGGFGGWRHRGRNYGCNY